MQRILIVTLAICTLVVPVTFAEQDVDVRRVVQDVTEALLVGDTSKLANVTAAQVELTLDGTTSIYTKAQARYVASAFLDKHPFQSARIKEINIVGRNCTARYQLVGQDEEDDWEFFLRLRSVDGQWEVREVRLATNKRTESDRSRQ